MPVFFSQVATATLYAARILVIVDEMTLNESLVGNSTGYCGYPIERDPEGLFISVSDALALDAMTDSCVE